MSNQPLFVGNSEYHPTTAPVNGQYVTLWGEEFYRIENYDAMPPFFMSIVSSADHWLFISSTGGVTAGRVNAEAAIFPYYTVDKVTENHENTGHKAILRVQRAGRCSLWEPFSSRYTGLYQLTRNIYKNVYGNKLVFEEINHDLQLTYWYAWRSSNRFGFVLSSGLTNQGEACEVNVLAGVQNLLPYGASTLLQNSLSNLLNAYKRNELETDTGLGIFALSSTLTDLAEPSESLQATTVWQIGLDTSNYLLSSSQLETFRRTGRISPETEVRGRRGAYLAQAELNLATGAEQTWQMVVDVKQDNVSLVTLLNLLHGDKAQLVQLLEQDIEQSQQALVKIIAQADGCQASADRLTTAHHVANVMFNTMRGGIFADNYQIDKADLLAFVQVRQPALLSQYHEFWANLPHPLTVAELLEQVQSQPANITRLGYEYLPLTFSRRHGDPSRPWNKFAINIKHADGSQRLDYQGNWRDIFQNWESLLYSYPAFTESVIAKFLNATTAEGYNPYRITREGIEWECPDPEDPWANIGYWSDHQIIYLQKLLELSAKFYPGRLEMLLNRPMFSLANVPYRLKSYHAILADWYNTITFDEAKHDQLTKLVKQMGSDGKLVLDKQGQVFHVTMAEKLLTLLLAKLVNFVPEGGIWMNTQRPEWNDANNALVGKGLSVVTVSYLRRFVTFLEQLLTHYNATEVNVTVEVKAFFDQIKAIFTTHQPLLQGTLTDQQRRTIMDTLGEAGHAYRHHYYEHGFSGQLTTLSLVELVHFLQVTQHYIDHTLRANLRADKLYHAYNLLRLGEKTASIDYLYEMLEGQAAVLSSGMLSSQDALDLLHSLRHGPLYRADQHSYILYPDRQLKGFLAKNQISAAQAQGSVLLQTLVANQNSTLIRRDENGDYHFNSSFHNAKDVVKTLNALAQQPAYTALVEQERAWVLDLFEQVFQHSQFTGRSGTFFAYEGLGSIYWHMVSKLLLAVQENYIWAQERGDDPALLAALHTAYYDIREGIGFNKTPQVYGAFPTDPYSHTPAGQGAEQPGMTGQVKEELLTRLTELGVMINHGELSFQPTLLRPSEFINLTTHFEYIDLSGQPQRLTLPPQALAFTFCQVPIVYQTGCASPRIVLEYRQGETVEVAGLTLSAPLCQPIFARNGQIRQITVHLT